MTVSSMFLAPVCTTSSKLLTVNLIVSAVEEPSSQFFSRNSRTVLDDRPIELACGAFSLASLAERGQPRTAPSREKRCRWAR